MEHKVIQAKDMQNLDVLLDLTPLAELDAHCHDAHDRFILKLTREGECPEDVDIVIVQHPFLANQFITVPPINELRVDDGSLVAFLDHKEETLYGNSLDITRFENIPEPKPIIIRNAGGVTLGDFYLKYAEG